MTALLRFTDWPLRAKMAALLVAVSILPLLIWAYVDLRQDRLRLLEGAKDLLEARGDQIARELDSFHRGYRHAAERLARIPDAAAYCTDSPERRAARHEGLAGVLAAHPASDPGIRGAALLDGSGRVVIATEAPLVGLDLSDRPVVAAALQGRTIVSDPFISSPRSGSVPTIAYMRPLLGAEGRVVCVAVLWVRAQALWTTVRASNALAGPGSFAVLFDREGICVAHTYSDDIVFHPAGPLDAATLERLVAERRFGAQTRALLEDVRAFPEQFERARAATLDSRVFRGLTPANGVWNYGVARRFETVPWTVFYMVPEAAIAAQIEAATRERIVLAMAVIAAAVTAALMFAGGILKPIRALSRATSAIAGGDFTARVQDHRGDELGQLDASFNAMAERLQAQALALEDSRNALERQVQARTAELTRTTRDLQAEIIERIRMNGVLRERDTALSRAYVMTKLAHVITRPDGSFETWSDTLPPLIGVTSADMPQSTREWLTWIHPDDRAAFKGSAIAAGVTGSRKDIRYRLQRADGVWIHLSQVIEPMPGPADADGRGRWFSAIQDVTEQVQSGESLRANQQLLQSIIDNSAAVIYVKDLQGRYLLVNRRYTELFHIAAEAVLGRSDHDLLAKDAADALRAVDQRVAATQDPLIEEEVVPLGDGPRTFVSVKCPLRDHEGQVCGVFGISTDITDRKLAESHLRSQLERLSLLDQITRAIAERQDLQSIYLVALRSIEERLPVDFSCVCRCDGAENALTVIRVGAHSQDLATSLAMGEQSRIDIDPNGLSRCVRGELVYEPDVQGSAFAFTRRLAAGGLRSLVVAPLQAEGRVFGILVAARCQPDSFSSGDCEFLRQLSAHVALAAQQAQLHAALQQAYDDLRQSQQTMMQQERLRALGQMASGIAHDINNAISPITLYTESLLEREPALTDRGRSYLTTIARAIDDVASTVSRMREFYREREPQVLLKPVQLNLLVPQVVELTRARWSDMPQQRGAVIDLQTDLAPDLPAVQGIESEVREALINLVFNAVDAMPNGGTLTLRTRWTELGGASTATRLATIEVADTGVGMDADTQRRCLEPFFTTKGERGTGLGLAMVYGTAQRHGAGIDIDSAVGRGTTVRLCFPVSETAPAQEAAKPRPQVSVPRLRILVVDDDPLLLKSLSDTLELDGHTVVAANGGQAGIEIFRAAQPTPEPFDVVITDLGMPHIDGRRVAQAVKACAEATPVILLTGWGQRLVNDGETPAHVDRILSKPPKLHEVRMALAQLTRAVDRAAENDSTGDGR